MKKQIINRLVGPVQKSTGPYANRIGGAFYGRSLVRGQRLGPEEISDPGFDSPGDWNTGVGWTVSGSRGNCSGVQVALTELSNIPSSSVAGVVYEVSYDVVSATNPVGVIAALIGNIQGMTRNAVGSYKEVIVAADGGAEHGFIASAQFIGSVDNFSVRKIQLVGSEEISDPGFDKPADWSAGVGWVVAESRGQCSGAQVAETDLRNISSSSVVDQAYDVKYNIVSYTAGTIAARIGNTLGVTRNAVGSYQEYIVAGSNFSEHTLRAGTTFVGSVGNFSVRKVA